MDNIIFKDRINSLEETKEKFAYFMKDGKTPVMLTAVHTVSQIKETGLKYSEPYTAAICQYVASEVNSYFMLKAIDNGVDSNSLIEDDFKLVLNKKIKENEIKLLIDIHGASIKREFDVEFGTLKNLTFDISAEKFLEDCFNENDIFNIKYNDPFCGGGITRYIYENNAIDIIQIEINGRYRDENDVEKCEKICNSLIKFIKEYANYN